MASKIGLQVPLDLGLESLISVPAKQPVASPVEAATPPEPSSLLTNEEQPVSEKQRKPRKMKEEKATPRTLYLTDSVFQRLQLMSILQKKRISTVVGDLLDKAAENLVIKKVS